MGARNLLEKNNDDDTSKTSSTVRQQQLIVGWIHAGLHCHAGFAVHHSTSASPSHVIYTTFFDDRDECLLLDDKNVVIVDVSFGLRGIKWNEVVVTRCSFGGKSRR